MELNLTTVERRERQRRDRIVKLPSGLSVGGLAEGLGQPGQPLFLGHRRLDAEAPLAGSGLREGGVLGIGAPADQPNLLQRPAGPAPVVIELHAVSGPEAGRIWRIGPGSHEIGSDPLCSIRLAGAGVPPRGLWVTVGPAGETYWHQTELVNGKVMSRLVGPPDDDAATVAMRVEDEEHPELNTGLSPATDPGESPIGQVNEWLPEEDLSVGSVLLRRSGELEPIAAVRFSEDGFGLDYNRPPRIAPHLDEERIRLPNPPSPPQRRTFPWPIVIAPVLMGMVMVGLFNSYYFLIFTLLGPLMMAMNYFSGRKSGRIDHREAIRRYKARMVALGEEINDAVTRERQVRNVLGPDPVRIAQLATMPGSRLWERRRHDDDYLMLRLGTVDQPSLKHIDDQSREENHRSIRWTIPDAPVALPVRAQGIIGLAGRDTDARALARWMVIQAAVMHSPRQLRIVVLAETDRMDDWAWIRWLPHLRSEATDVVMIANDELTTSTRVSELLSMVQGRKRRVEADRHNNPLEKEMEYLVIADGARRLRDVPGFIQVLTDGPAVGFYSVCLDRDERLLPEECSAVIVAGRQTLTVKLPGQPDQAGVRTDLVTSEWCEQIARALAPVRDVSPDHDAGLPRRVKLLEELDLEPPAAETVLERWLRRPASTSFVLGADFDGRFAVDLVHDGPHGLIAGTTGSGKSELLQTMVASLAVANRPDELTFVLVDYKGGSAFKECAGLPHTLGMVTDLDTHLVERVLESLEAELRRREHILADTDAKDLPDYQAKRLVNPQIPRLPRLVLVIDEFAAMIREIPDFVPGLIGIAQRGRSLGIHLILATQRPAGVVTGDIRANTNLRIALRVTDQAESQDVVDVNEAASLDPSVPGRAVIRRGPRLADVFQTAWVGAERDVVDDLIEQGPADPANVLVTDVDWESLGTVIEEEELPPALEDEAPATMAVTDLMALVETVRQAADQLEDFATQPQPWKPALGAQLLLGDLPDSSHRKMFAPYALEDLPTLQQQRVAGVDYETFGHLYVIGAPRSGRTQALRTIATSSAKRLSVADLHIYGFDAAGGGLSVLETLPHCGAIVTRHDLERMNRLLRRLNQEVTTRQELSGRHNATGLTELRKILPKAERPAHLLVLIDGWDALTSMLDEHDQGQMIQDVVRLLREGAGVGVHVVASSERSLLGGRLSQHNDHKLLLRQADRTDYQAAGLKISKVPANVIPGRGWHVLSGTETQIALLAEGGGSEQVDAIREVAAETRKRDTRVPAERRPFTVAELPSLVEFSAAYELVAEADRRPLWGMIGVGGDQGGAIGVDLAGSGSSFGVLGPPGTGRSNSLACLAVSLLATGTALVLITPRDSQLRLLAQHPQVIALGPADPPEDLVRQSLEQITGPKVVMIDDADMLMSAGADKVLKEIVGSGRDNGVGLVFGASTDGFQSGMGGWPTAARRARRGLLIEPRSISEGELIGVRLSHNIVRATPKVGRAWTTGPGQTPIAVQLPLTTLRA